ncbi:MAG TPA: hypothetical protein VLG50_08905 [Candidatus Saccharimonadales bacterium]|nr:hypothetical protein [Candidatus Saccharimonadales bacterium]
MLNRTLIAYFYILFGLLLIIIVGGELLFKLLCIFIGIIFVARGLAQLGASRVASHMNSRFFSDDDFHQ